MSGKKNKFGYKQKQEQVNLVAHHKVLAFENFRYLLETLEEYIEKKKMTTILILGIKGNFVI